MQNTFRIQDLYYKGFNAISFMLGFYRPAHEAPSAGAADSGNRREDDRGTVPCLCTPTCLSCAVHVRAQVLCQVGVCEWTPKGRAVLSLACTLTALLVRAAVRGPASSLRSLGASIGPHRGLLVPLLARTEVSWCLYWPAQRSLGASIGPHRGLLVPLLARTVAHARYLGRIICITASC